MLPAGLLTVAYVAASILFILSLGGLSNQESARRGNLNGIIGMLIAIAATAIFIVGGFEGVAPFTLDGQGFGILSGAILVGALIGAALAARVAMTSMPELVAVLHSFVGLAAVLVGISSYLSPLGGGHALTGTEKMIHEIEIYLDVLIGSVTFTGSVIAFLKLRRLAIGQTAHATGAPRDQPRDGARVRVPRLCVRRRAGSRGADAALDHDRHLRADRRPHGHGDRRRGHAGRRLDAQQLFGLGRSCRGLHARQRSIAGHRRAGRQLGAILSYIMCAAMNRSFVSVILGGFGGAEGVTPAATGGEVKGRDDVTEASVAQTVELLRDAKSIIIVPGYGMAVAQAQHSLSEAVKLLRKAGTEVRFGIHPVAGRLPGT